MHIGLNIYILVRCFKVIFDCVRVNPIKRVQI